MRITRLIALVAAALLLSVGAACSDDSTGEPSADPGSESSTAQAGDDSGPEDGSVSDDDPGSGDDAGASDSPCERFAASIPFDGDWEAGYAPEDEARGYDNSPPEGDVNYDRRLGCGASIPGGTAGVAADAQRIVDAAEWEETYTYRTGEAGCRAATPSDTAAKAYVCPPDDRTDWTYGVVGVDGWVYQLGLDGFDGSTSDAEVIAAVEAWVAAVGDPTSYDLLGPESLPAVTTAPPVTPAG